MPERTRSESSLGSIGFGSAWKPPNVNAANLPKPIEFSISKLEPDGGGAPPGEYIYNSIAMIIHCKRHQKVVISFNERTKATWLPFIAAPQNKTWSDATREGIQMIFTKEDAEIDARLVADVNIEKIQCIHILRLQLPISQKYVERIVMLVQLGANTPKFICCQDSKRLKWVKLEEAIEGKVERLWGPEVAIFSSFLPTLKQQEIYEYGLNQAYYFVPKNLSAEASSSGEEMLRSIGLGQAEVEKIYGDFLEHCFPAFFMAYDSFLNYIKEYMPESNLKEKDVLIKFHAFNFSRNGYLKFHELLLGLVAMEPSTPTNVSRLKTIFRYYNTNTDNNLTENEFGQMLVDLNLDPTAFKPHLATLKNKIEWKDFHQLVSQYRMPMDKLCRHPYSVIARICSAFTIRNERRASASKRTEQKASNRGTGQENLCLAHREKKYDFATHCVRLDPSGRCAEPRHLPDFEINGEEEKTDEISMNKYSQDYVFSAVSIGHTFLDMIRDFSQMKGKPSQPNGFLASREYRDIFIQYLKILCMNLRNMFKCEEKLIKVNAPAYVIGDIRGNLDDLMMMERCLWHEMPVVPINFIFLGNYVNMGAWGLECILYLLALKVIAPNKIFLIRGQNETRETQMAAQGFRQECMDKYGQKQGLEIWEEVNTVFDWMAISVIIDEYIICVNTGLPIKTNSAEEIRGVKAELKDPLSDPIARELLSGQCSANQMLDFLRHNELSHVIRGNQFLQDGFLLSAQNKCFNIFSSSHYCGKSNQTAVLNVDHPLIRIVMLDSSKCETATIA